MLWIIYALVFLISFKLLYFSGAWIIGGLARIARFLNWSEFTVAFFVMAAASSLPNLFLGVSSALGGIPQLSFGDVMGNNIVAITLAVAIAIFFAPKREIATKSQIVRATSLFTMAAAVLPIILIADGLISRTDGVLLIAFFLFYVGWLFSKRDRFSKVYNHETELPIHDHHKEIRNFFKSSAKISLGIILTLLASQGIISSALFFSKELGLPLIFIGIIAAGLGNALPEIHFAAISAKKGRTSLILGNLMGSVIIPATLVLGIVALIHPIRFSGIRLVAISRFFLLAAALFFFLFVRTDKKITAREAAFLFLIYILFVLSAILFTL